MKTRLMFKSIGAAFLVGAAAVVSAEEKAEETPGTTETSATASPTATEAEPRFEIGVFNLSSNGEYFFITSGTLTTPVDDNVSFSVEGILGASADSPLVGGAARLYWRDAEIGKFGVYGSGVHLELGGEGFSVYGVGAEGALYFDKLSVNGAAGVTMGSGVPDKFVAVGSLAYQPIEQIRLSVGTKYFSDKFHGVFDVEYTFRDYGVSIFGGGSASGEDDWQILSGLKIDLSGGNGGGGGGGSSSTGAAQMTSVAVSAASTALDERAEEEAIAGSSPTGDATTTAGTDPVVQGPCTHTHDHGHGSAREGHSGHGHGGPMAGKRHTHSHTHKTCHD